MRRLACAALLVAGCALGPGEPMGVLEPTLAARYALRADRHAADGFQRLATDYEVRVTRAELELGPLALEERGAVNPGVFDPARPPPGYSLCHNGHCHADDGRLVAYEDIAAELGGGVQVRTVVALRGPGVLDLLGGETTPLACEPDCVLSAARIRRITAPVRRLHLAGEVRDGRAAPRLAGTRPFAFTLEEPAEGSGLVLTTEVDVPVDREHAPRIQLALALELGAALFDPLDWAAVAAEPGPIELNGAAPPGARQEAYRRVLGALGEQVIGGEVTRRLP